MELEENEISKPVFGYEDEYVITSHGRLYSKQRFGATGRWRIPRAGRHGYPYVVLCKNNRPKTFKIHRLVALAFVPNPENKPQVNHIDGNKLNNRVENLEWCTSKENVVHAWKMGLSKSKTGEENAKRKVSSKERLDIARDYATGLNQVVLSEKYKISQTLVSLIVRGVLRELIETNQAINAKNV